MSTLHIFCETGAFGDTALNLCRCWGAMQACGHTETVVHTTPYFLYGSPPVATPLLPEALEIFKRCHWVKEVVMDCDYQDRSSFAISKRYGCPIEQPLLYSGYHNVTDWLDLTDLVPEMDESRPLAVFQPISVSKKQNLVTTEELNSYIPVWDRCLKALLDRGYRVVMVGAPDDPIDLCVKPELLEQLDNKIGKWSLLQALAFALYKAEVSLSCDSWLGVWTIAARKPTAICWGHRYENDIDAWVIKFLGNTDCYRSGWGSQKEWCDAVLAAYLNQVTRGRHEKV